MKSEVVALTHLEGGKYAHKVTRYIPRAQRKVALRFTYRELVDALPLSTYTHTILLTFLAYPIIQIYVNLAKNLFAEVGGTENYIIKTFSLCLTPLPLILTLGLLAFITFSREGKKIRREIRAKYISKVLKKPHVVLLEDKNLANETCLRICRLGLLRNKDVDKSSTYLIPKETYQKLEEKM